MKILGISAFFHDSAAAIIIDDKIVAAAEEERFSRVKHDNRFPINSINFVLKKSEVFSNELDGVVFYEKPHLKFHRILSTNKINLFKNFNLQSELFDSWNKNKISARNYISEILNIKKNKIFFYEHHFSHAASSYFCSNFKQSDFITIDGVGEWSTTTYGQVIKKKLLKSFEIDFPHSIGLLYTAFTEFLGFEVNEGEYKVMGMAPYGRPIYEDKIDKLFKRKGIFFELDLSYFNFNIESSTNLTPKFINEFGERREFGDIFYLDRFKNDLYQKEVSFLKNTNNRSQYFADIAASLQSYLEKFLVDILKKFQSKNNSENLCYSGGVAYNSAINQKIIESKIYKNIFIQPAAGDSGGSLGCALGANYLLGGNIVKYENTYLGQEYSNSEIEEYLKLNSIDYKYYDNFDELCIQVANCISGSKLVGWFQGRFEFGPRALGNRSILGDPRFFENKKIINSKIKFREIFRPFAPSTLSEYFEDYYEVNNANECEPYKYMLSTVKVKKDFIQKLAAVTHVNGTARAQIVFKDHNPKYYNLIKKFGEITGVYTLLNTSFNRKGEPIVNSPQEALNVFFWTDLDILVLNNFMIKK